MCAFKKCENDGFEMYGAYQFKICPFNLILSGFLKLCNFLCERNWNMDNIIHKLYIYIIH